MILTPNGAKLNGFVPLKRNGMRNGELPNGHMTQALPSQYKNTVMDSEVCWGTRLHMVLVSVYYHFCIGPSFKKLTMAQLLKASLA